MTWTDQHLADLLTATFTSHEADADPAVAQRIALTTPPAGRRTWPVLAAAVVVVVVLVVGLQALRPEPRPVPAGPVPAPTVDGHNRTIARAEASSLLVNVPLPPRARPVGSSPVPGLRRLGAYILDVDPSLTRTGWWVVPMPYDDLVAWYATNVPDAHADEEDTWWTAAATSAYTAPAVIVSYARRGAASTAMRVDVTLAARDDRTEQTFVPDGVTSVDVTRTDITGPVGPPATTTVTDPAAVRAIVVAFNGLLGAPVADGWVGCASPVGDLHVYSATFHWAGHTLSVDPGAPLCGQGRSLVLDGRELEPALEDSDAFSAALAAGF